MRKFPWNPGMGRVSGILRYTANWISIIHSESANTYSVWMAAVARPACHQASANAGSSTSGAWKAIMMRRAAGSVSLARGSSATRYIQLAGTPAGSSKARRVPRISRYPAVRGAASGEPWGRHQPAQPQPHGHGRAMRFAAQQGTDGEAVAGARKSGGARCQEVEQRQQPSGEPLLGWAAFAFQDPCEAAAIAAGVRDQHQQEDGRRSHQGAVRQVQNHGAAAQLQVLIEAQEPERWQKADGRAGCLFQRRPECSDSPGGSAADSPPGTR